MTLAVHKCPRISQEATSDIKDRGAGHLLKSTRPGASDPASPMRQHKIFVDAAEPDKPTARHVTSSTFRVVNAASAVFRVAFLACDDGFDLCIRSSDIFPPLPSDHIQGNCCELVSGTRAERQYQWRWEMRLGYHARSLVCIDSGQSRAVLQPLTWRMH